MDIGRHTRQTSVKIRTLNPTWNERFNFILTTEDVKQEPALCLLVQDWDSFGEDEQLGTAAVPWTELTQSPGKETTVTLSLRDNVAQKDAGTLSLSFMFLPTEMEDAGAASAPIEASFSHKARLNGDMTAMSTMGWLQTRRVGIRASIACMNAPKRLFFVLSRDSIDSFEDEEAEIVGHISLPINLSTRIEEPPVSTRISWGLGKYAFCVQAPGKRKLRLGARDTEEKAMWISSIEALVKLHEVEAVSDSAATARSLSAPAFNVRRSNQSVRASSGILKSLSSKSE